ncbi:MAG: long-chain fatty acid--CoA ligase, partial [Geminicoccaceae bacterium]|nr:long-chain fatty acid--CoA ligase [Geminicoccaceae bacterium]
MATPNRVLDPEVQVAAPGPIVDRKSGQGSGLAADLVELFLDAARRGGERPFLWAKREGVYQPWSWQRCHDEVLAIATAFRAHGLVPGERVLLCAENRPEWALADLATMLAGGITVPAYTTNTTDDHLYLLQHSEASAVVVSNRRIAERLFPAIRAVGGLKLVLCLDAATPADDLGVPAVHWDEALALGQRHRFQPEPIDPDDIACLIYTSGTGGRPKGVMLTHRNILANVKAAHQVLTQVGLGDDVFLSFLPLSHAYEHTAGQFFPMAVDAQIFYAEGVETLQTNLVETRPTIMACVPRLYEVRRQRILSGVDRAGGLKARLFHKAVELGSRAYEDPTSLSLAERLMNRSLDRLVRSKVKERFGGRMKALVSGGAPLNYDIGLFFTALGLPLLQGYGQTENGPVASVNLPGKVKLHTVGPPLPGMEVKIAPDGEILLRGDAIMKGYWKDEAASAEALRDGWLHTGDVGVIDEDGYIQITDRKRDLIVNSGGDNIAPQRVEGILALEP